MRKLDQELAKFKMELEADNAGITEILEQSKSWCMRSRTTRTSYYITASSISQNSSGPCCFKNDDLNWSSVTKSVIIFVHLTCRLCDCKIIKGT